MKYCSECGAKLGPQTHALGSMDRFVCTGCRAVFHQSPRLAAGCIARWEDRILLCQRAVEPGAGLWELPAGFVASQESTAAAARRETLEEAGVAAEIEDVYALLHIPHIDQLRVIYRARLLGDQFHAGTETHAVALFDEADIPWQELAFATTRDALRQYFADRKAGEFRLFFAEIVPFRLS